jgi:hypothetical protein
MAREIPSQAPCVFRGNLMCNERVDMKGSHGRKRRGIGSADWRRSRVRYYLGIGEDRTQVRKSQISERDITGLLNDLRSCCPLMVMEDSMTKAQASAF